MKINKKGVFALVCAVLMFALCACGGSSGKTSDGYLTTEEFEKKAEKSGLTVPAFNNAVAPGLSDSSIVVKADGSKVLWQVEYYLFNNEESAVASYDLNKTNFEKDGGTGTTTEADGKVKYEIKNAGKFRYMCRIGRTFMYLDVEEKYESEAKAFVNKVGY